jgi:hypothetical protein
MRRPLSLASALVAAVCFHVGSAHAQTVDDIIATNLKSKGGLEKIRATTTVRMTGTVVARDMSGQNVKGTMAMVGQAAQSDAPGCHGGRSTYRQRL